MNGVGMLAFYLLAEKKFCVVQYPFIAQPKPKNTKLLMLFLGINHYSVFIDNEHESLLT